MLTVLGPLAEFGWELIRAPTDLGVPVPSKMVSGPHAQADSASNPRGCRIGGRVHTAGSSDRRGPPRTVPGSALSLTVPNSRRKLEFRPLRQRSLTWSFSARFVGPETVKSNSRLFPRDNDAGLAARPPRRGSLAVRLALIPPAFVGNFHNGRAFVRLANWQTPLSPSAARYREHLPGGHASKFANLAEPKVILDAKFKDGIEIAA